ncbi:MAG TPA: acyl-CoA desaturase [Bacteroidia bacterium]|nr:acyl-CoA desaturase [Bacteroidia bacterium]
MQVVRFISADPTEKQFAAAVRKNVGDYFREKGISTKGNGWMYVKAAVLLGTYIAPFVVLLTVPVGWPLALLLVFLMGIGEAGVGMSVMHDAVHGSFSAKKSVNELFSWSMFLLGSNIFNWKVQHNILHHTFTNIYGYDEDIETKAVIRLCDHAPRKKFHRFQLIYAFFFYGLMTLSKLTTDFSQLIAYNRRGITREQKRNPSAEMLKLIAGKLAYLFIILGFPLLFTSFTWWQILTGFAILHITAGMIMSTIFQMAHVVEGTEQPVPDEKGVIAHDWVVHEMRTTSDFAPKNHFLNWYAGGLNFQIEHHLFPNTCHIHYRKIAPIVEQTAQEFGIAYNRKPTFGAALVSHLKRLKELGKQPS